MTRNIDDISVESILDSIFSNEEETVDIPSIEPELKEELTEEEQEILESPTDEEEGADEESIGEESVRLLGEVDLMNFALKTAESFIWAKSLEEDSSVKDGEDGEDVKDGEDGEDGEVATEAEKNVFKKFWEWLVKIVEKIRMFLVTSFKRIQVWLAGDMKGVTEWYKKNKSDIDLAISKQRDVTLKIKMPETELTTIEGSLKKLKDALEESIIDLDTGKVDEKNVTVLKDELEKLGTISKIKEQIYGKDAKSKDVKLSTFNASFKIGNTLSTIGTYLKEAANKVRENIKDSNVFLKAAKTNAKDIVKDKEEMKKIKDLASLCQRALNFIVSTDYAILSAKIYIIKISRSYAAKALAANKKSDK